MTASKLARLRGIGGYTGGPAWKDEDLMRLVNAEQIVTLWSVHILGRSRQEGWRPLDGQESIQRLIDTWHSLFDAFAKHRDDAAALRTVRMKLLTHARRIAKRYRQ